MKFASAAAVLLLLACGAADAAGTRDHPVVKVIDLLKGLKDKVIEEGKTEEVTYSKFEKWCADSTRSLQKAVTEGKENIEILKSKVESLEMENATLVEQIATLGEELLTHEKLAAEAKKAREDQNALYVKADTDLEASIAAFGDAVTALEGAKSSTSLVQATALRGAISQLRAPAVGALSDLQIQRLAQAMRRVSGPDDALPDFLAKGDYGQHVKKYAFKSDNVIDLLKELKLNFEDQRVEGTKMETAAANSYDLAKSARDAAVAAATSAKGTKETNLSDCLTALAGTQSSLDSAEADLVADETSLADTVKDCDMKRSEWDERTKIREQEVEAIKKGIEILAKVTGVRTEAPSNPVPPPSPVEAAGALFLQTDPKAKAINMLRQEATKLHNKQFSKFTDQLAGKLGGPFDALNDMIQKMIFRLMDEQKDEDEHKNWCDLELAKTNTSIEDKDAKLTELGLKIEADKATVEELASEITAADDKVAEITKFVQEATEVRTDGKTENEIAIKDAKDAQDAIAKAIAVLQDFYKDSGMVAKEAWEFVQRNSAPVALSDTPSTWAAGYTGVADPKNQPDGIITVLEKISADFSKMEADTKAQESTDQKNYQEEKKEFEIEMARRQKESEMKGQEKSRLLEKVSALEKSKKHTTEELDATKQYEKDLQPACVEGDSSYDDRKAAREAETTALKEAQVILADAFKAEPDAKLVQIFATSFN
mmetsp:Transcript_98846/g.316900  ORF Transcript_98846/g.316900 Transcript_98846/m.316900 type:complete len:714 (-) Transcript_98846:92-2233(-)